MPSRTFGSALFLILLAIWPVLATGQVADLIEIALPPPAIDLRSDRAARLLGPGPAAEDGDLRAWTVGYERREPFTTRSTDDLALFAAQDRFLRLTLPHRRGVWRSGISAVRTRQTTAGWIDDRAAGPHLSGRDDRVDVEVWLGRGSTWRVRSFAPVWSEGDDRPRRTAGWDAAWSPAPEIGFAFSRRTTDLRSRFHAPVIDDFIDFRLNTRLNLNVLEARIDPLPQLTVRVVLLDGDGEPATPLRGVATDEMQLTGRLRGSKMKAVVEPRPGIELAYAAGAWSLFGEGGLYRGGQRYGRLNALIGDMDEREMSATWQARPGLALKLVYAERGLTVFGRGRIESWPFTETAIDLLGVRQVAEADLDVAFERLALGAAWTKGGRDVRLGWSRHVIRPEGTLETWIPGLFGVGRTDYVRRVIDAESLTIHEVRLALRTELQGVSVFFDVRQFVAVSTEPPADDPAEPGPDDPTTPALPDEGWWGGLFLSSGVTIPF